MKIYIGNCGNRDRQQIIIEHPRLGQLLLPNYITLKPCKCSFVYDNGAYSSYVQNKPFDEKSFLKSLKKTIEYKEYCDFAVIPDIVAGGLKSLEFSMDWFRRLPRQLKWYLPIQDGMLFEHIEKLGGFDGLFIGGTKEWKYKYAESWVKYAHNRRLKCHIGRVGTERKVLWAEHIGADSIDSSNFAQNKIHWRQLMDLLAHKQENLLNLTKGGRKC